MKYFTVSILLEDRHDSEQRTYLFDNEDEAKGFSAHMLNLYGYMEANVQEHNSFDTYDSAIQDVVESIGPSSDHLPASGLVRHRQDV